eukprot:scaffold17871_cov82-Phaeocystis_antarctica.AAC.15
MPIAERLAHHLQCLAKQRLSGGEVALGPQHHAEIAGDGERLQMPIAELRACHLQRLAERVQGEDYALAIRALGLEPCTQKLDTQRIAVLVLALPTAVSCVLPRARAPPFFEAGFVDPLGRAAARARPHERAVVLFPPAHPAHLLVLVLG